MRKSEAITEHLKHWEKFPVFVWDENGEFVTEVDGRVFRAKTPFGLDTQLDDAGAPEPRNLYFIDAPDYEDGSKMTEEQEQEFEAITRPVIEWLNVNFHPHVTVVIDPTSAVLSEGTIAYTTHDYLRD